jgi:GAF domain
MRNRWVGLEAGVDALRWARLLGRAHEIALHGGRTPAIVRNVIADSWTRSEAAGVDAGEPGAPLVIDPEDASGRWEEHPLAHTTATIQAVLKDLLYDARHIVVVSDADGCLLWSDGHPEVLRASEAIRFCPGHAWSESAAGTNAVGTALAADHAVQVFSAEHFRAEVHSWQCSASPVHDPETGRIIGAIDVTGSYKTAHPHNLALVQLAARLVEEQLRRELLEREHEALEERLFAMPDGGRLHGEPPKMRLETLGCRQASIHTPSEVRRLSRRHGELAVLLALHPDGLDARELAMLLYDEPGHEVSVRAELHRLGCILGPCLARRPYRLERVESDVANVLELLEEGRHAEASAGYRGPLLRGSELREVVAVRERLERELFSRLPAAAGPQAASGAS